MASAFPRCFGTTRYQRLMLLAILLHSAVGEWINFQLTDSTLDKVLVIYVAKFIDDVISLLFYVDAVMNWNSFQLLAFLVVAFLDLAEHLVTLANLLTHRTTSSYKEVLVLLNVGWHVLSCIVYCLLAYKIHLEFNWQVFKNIGANMERKRQYRTYLVFMTLLKLTTLIAVIDVLGYVSQGAVVSLKLSAEFVLTLFMFVLALFAWASGTWGVRTESYLWSTVSLVSLMVIGGYFLSMMVLYLAAGVVSMVVSTVIGCVILMATIVFGNNAQKNFRTGLRPYCIPLTME